MTDWTAANCRDTDVDMFPSPADRVGGDEARRVCRGCPVQAECLAELESMPITQRVGVWAGIHVDASYRLIDPLPVLRCVECEQVLVVPSGKRGPKPRYCSRYCARKADRRRQLLRGVA